MTKNLQRSKTLHQPGRFQETGLEKPETLVQSFPEPEDVKIFDGFRDTPEAKLKELYDSLNLAMTFKDFYISRIILRTMKNAIRP